MSRRKWSPVRRHMNRYMLYYLLGAGVLVLIVGITWVSLRAARAVDEKVNGRPQTQTFGFSVTSDSTVLAGGAKEAADLILPFCKVKDVDLLVYLPGKYRDVMGIAYHEARNDKAFALEPRGYLLKNDNSYKVDVALDTKTPLPTYYIMETRFEDQPATSACDIAMREGAMVLSPVDGVVSRVEAKILYGTYDDNEIQIIPDGCPDIRVILIHVKDIQASAGQTVQKGKTVIGTPRDYREHFESEIDDYIKPAHPHVQVQVNRYVPEPETPAN